MPDIEPAAPLQGIAASPGRARGPVFTVEEEAQHAGEPDLAAATSEEVAAAADLVARQLEDLAAYRRDRAPDAAAILEAQALMARDPALQSAVDESLAAGHGARTAISGAIESYAGQLEQSGDPYLAARGSDVREVGRLLVAWLAGQRPSRLARLAEPSVVVSQELTAADTLAAEPGRILAFVTESGGATSHVAIVARELGIPAVVGAAGAVAATRRGGVAGALVDGTAGTVRWLAAGELGGVEPEAAGDGAPLDLESAPVPLMANAGSVAAVRAAAAQGLRGVGLFRTEFLFLSRSSPPDEDEQAEAYASACAAMAPHPVVVRSLDAGSDKSLPYLAAPGEPNPALGRRGVRLWLANEELLRAQVRALARTAARHQNLWVMVPMVGAREEMQEVRAVFEDEGRRLGPTPPLGMMVELPATAMSLEVFSDLVDFVSIGTNDLSQYALGADRELEWPPFLGEFNPGGLRLIAEAVRAARRAEIKVGVCGELAGRPEGAVFLVGVGADSLSMSASSAGAVLEALRRAGVERCREAASAALGAQNAEGALAALRSAAGSGG